VHILLTDILTCPRCGPAFGLILLADRTEQRRVRDGTLGCPSCRAHYAVRDGAAHCGGEPTRPAGDPSAEAAIRLAALIGLAQGSRYALLIGPAAAHASALAALLDGLEVIAVGEPGEEGRAAAGAAGVNPLGIGDRLPLTNARVGGVALTGARTSPLLEEGARVLAPLGRLLLDPAPLDAEDRLRALGLRIVARDGAAAVAARG
jgi:uncharacterized protein YbaR (Trm112 family)